MSVQFFHYPQPLLSNHDSFHIDCCGCERAHFKRLEKTDDDHNDPHTFGT